jgi:hypothetical protein
VLISVLCPNGSIVVLISVFCPDGSIHISKNINVLEIMGV